MIKMELPVKRAGERHSRSLIVIAREEMRAVVIREVDVKYRVEKND